MNGDLFYALVDTKPSDDTKPDHAGTALASIILDGVLAVVEVDDDEGEDLKWRDAATGLHEQPATAIYRNMYGNVVIRQQGAAEHRSSSEDDQWLLFGDDRAVERLIVALACEIGLDLSIGKKGRR